MQCYEYWDARVRIMLSCPCAEHSFSVFSLITHMLVLRFTVVSFENTRNSMRAACGYSPCVYSFLLVGN